MNPSIKMIAEQVGCSSATVSRALSSTENVRPALKRKIISVAQSVGYRSNRLRILLICESLDLTIYHRQLLTSLSRIFHEANHTMELIDQNSINLIEDRNISGGISILLFDGLERIWGKQHAIPLVCINTTAFHLDGIYSVMNDDESGTRQMAEYLIELGHQKIGIYGWSLLRNASHQYYEKRLDTFKAVMREHNFRDDFIAARSSMTDEICSLIKPLLDQGVTAFIGNGEDAGFELLHALQLLGRKVPQEVSIVSWMAPEFRRFTYPALTGVMQDFNKIAEFTAKLLLDQIAGIQGLHDITIPSLWICGGSARKNCASL